MLAWVIGACQDSRYITDIYVSSEDEEILSLSQKWGALTIKRPFELATDGVYKQEVISHAVQKLLDQGRQIDTVVAVQPNSPEIEGPVIDAAIEKFRERGLWELFSVGPDLIQNAAFRIMLPKVVFQKALSVYCGVSVVDCIDIHTLEDVKRVEKRLRSRSRQPPALTVVNS